MTLRLDEYPLLLWPLPVADPAWRRAARWLTVALAYALGLIAFVALPFMMAALAKDPAERSFAALTYAVLFLLPIGTAAALLALSIALRPRPLSAPAAVPACIFVLHEWGFPRAMTMAVFACVYFPPLMVLFRGLEHFDTCLLSVSPGLRVVLALVVLVAALVAMTVLADRIVLALRRRFQDRFPHRPLLVAGEAGIALKGAPPLEWAAVRDVRLKQFTAGNNRFWMMAVDTATPPAADDARSHWAHRYLHGESFAVSLRTATLPPHDALAAVRALRPR